MDLKMEKLLGTLRAVALFAAVIVIANFMVVRAHALQSSSSSSANSASANQSSSAPPTSTSQTSATPANPDDVKSVDAIVAALYRSVSGAAGAHDWSLMRSLFVPEGRLTPSGKRDGKDYFRSLSLEEYISRSGGTRQQGFFEGEVSRKMERFGHVAQVFSTYASRRTPDGAPFVRGINSIQLVFDGQRWWIVSVLWDSETPEQPIPAEFSK